MPRPRPRWALALPLVALFAGAASAQTLDKERRRGRDILRQVARLLERRYFDASLGGAHLRARMARAEAEMMAATSERATFGVVARLVADLDDSHTFFVPPADAGAVDHGWTPRVVGERCFVAAVSDGSHAAARGLRPGDEILSVEGVPPDRARLWTTLHLARLLRPRPEVALTLRGTDGARREVTVVSQVLPAGRAVSFHEYIRSLRRRLRGRFASRFAEAGGVLVWRLSSFEKDGRAVDEGLARAGRSRALVLDLRGNGGGDEGALRRIAGAFFAEDAAPPTLAWLRSRKGLRALTAERPRRGRAYAGPLVVLVDSDSASASEVFARTVQLRRRGTVVGDRTAGAVRLSRTHVIMASRDRRFVPYAVSVSEAEVEMPGGHSLEKTGVIPDELVLPTAEDLRAGRDPALARAVALLGGALSAEDAGRVFAGAAAPLD